MSNDVLEAVPGPEPGSDPTPEADLDDDVVVLPWWRNPVNLVAIALSLALLGGAIGYVIGNNRAIPNANDVDVGFLQDMRVHHEQAVQMSFIFLADEGTDGDLRTIAREILVGQNMEIGRMIQLLRDYGKPEVNDSDLAMVWMGEPVDVDRMPGLATQDDIDALVDASGADADRIFVQLMSTHHEGGVHMADYAAEHAGTAEVRLMAEQMAGSQREEIIEMRNLLARSQAEG
ncbi:MAG: DUF305 domain-containing protein [Ilumatobacteraceae bacterium]